MGISGCRRLSAALLLCVAVIASSLTALAQEAGTKNDQKKEAKKKTSQKKTSAKESTEEKAKVDPRVVPDGGIPELMKYINELRRLTPVARTRQAYSAHYRLVSPAIIKAADRILALKPTATQDRTAKVQKLSALRALAQWDASAKPKTEAFAKTLSEDKDPQLAKLGKTTWLSYRVLNAPKLKALNAEQISSLTNEVFELVKDSKVDGSSFGLARTLARSLEYAEKYDSSAKVLERLQPLALKSSDKRISAYAPKLTGAIKRLNLPGNPLELNGTTSDGKPFEWSKYKGKVVLIDYWASWCGPCIAELPNVENNYKLYHDKGFEIVGINMDRTRAAMDRFLAKRELSWEQIVSFENGKNSWNHPTATFYGISSIPSTMLVDQKGNVVSLRARGPALGRLLKDLLGEVNAAAAPPGEN